MKNELNNKKDLKISLSTQKAVLLYFYNDNCQPCVALRPKILNMVEEHFPKMKLFFINATQHPEITAQYGIFASPTIITFFENKEYGRYSKYITIDELKSAINRIYHLLFS